MPYMYWWKVVNNTDASQRHLFLPFDWSNNSTSNDGISVQKAFMIYVILIYFILFLAILIALTGCLNFCCRKVFCCQKPSCIDAELNISN